MNVWWVADPEAALRLILVLAALAGGCFGVWLLFLLPAEREKSRRRLRAGILTQLHLATARGLPLGEALSALAHDLEEQADRMQGVFDPGYPFEETFVRADSRQVAALAERLADGGLVEGLAELRGPFPAPWPELLERARVAGTLGPTLEAALEHDRAQLHARGLLQGQLVYPSLLLLLLSAPIAFWQLALGPKLLAISRDLDRYGPEQLDLRALYSAAGVLGWAVAILFLLLWLAARSGGWRHLRSSWSWLPSPFPGLRRAQRSLAAARLQRGLAAGLLAGLSLPEALVAAGPLGGLSDEAVQDAARRAGEGEDLPRALGGALRGAAELPAAEPGALRRGAARAQLRGEREIAAAARLIVPLSLLVLGALVGLHSYLPFATIHEIYRRSLW